jgi:signal transduction histidine kinase
VGEFLRGRLLFLGLTLLSAAYFALLLHMLGAGIGLTVFLPALLLVSALFSLVPEYWGKNRYYRELRSVVAQLDKKHLLAEVVERPDFAEGQILYETLRAAGKAMNDEIARYRLSAAEYREYIELWVHEVKTPLAGLKLALENSRNVELLPEVDKLENLVEQALFYARSGNVEADYSIHQDT